MEYTSVAGVSSSRCTTDHIDMFTIVETLFKYAAYHPFHPQSTHVVELYILENHASISIILGLNQNPA